MRNTRMNFQCFIVMSGLCGLGGVAPAFADLQNVPFEASLAGTGSSDLQTTANFQGVGNATHLGLTTNVGAASLSPPIYTDACAAGWGIPNVNVEILTAANGDQLVLEMHDLACPVGGFAFEGTGAWNVVHGTGRFANASGSGSLSGFFDVEPGTFEFFLTGELAY